MLHISPGVYVSIVDQSEFINAVPTVVGFEPFFSDRGVDGKLTFINGQKTLRTSFYVEDLSKQGKNFREGWMSMDRWLAISGSAYGMRLLPDDASYATLMYAIDKTNASAPILTLETVADVNSELELDTIIDGSTLPTIDPIALYHGYARGEWYNDLSLNLVEVANEPNVYVADIYEKDSGGDDFISSSNKISFIENAVDLEGESLYAEDVLNKYSELLNVKINQEYFASLDTFHTDANVKAILSAPPASPARSARTPGTPAPGGTPR